MKMGWKSGFVRSMKNLKKFWKWKMHFLGPWKVNEVQRHAILAMRQFTLAETNGSLALNDPPHMDFEMPYSTTKCQESVVLTMSGFLRRGLNFGYWKTLTTDVQNADFAQSPSTFSALEKRHWQAIWWKSEQAFAVKTNWHSCKTVGRTRSQN